MFLLTLKDKKQEGAYAVQNKNGEKVLFLFEEEDDAERYAMQLEEDGYPEMHVLEVETDMMLNVCEQHGYVYVVISKNDIVVPPLKPNSENDFI